MLDTALLRQVSDVFAALDAHYTLDFYGDPAHAKFAEYRDFLTDFASTSPHLDLRTTEAAGRLDCTLLRGDASTGITFRGIPGGHEFTSLILAVLNADGKGKNLPDAGLTRRIERLNATAERPQKLTTYISLSCTNCPDVVQALNIVALLHPHIAHEVVDGGVFTAEVEALQLQGVPAVLHEGLLLHSGRSTMADLIDRLEAKLGALPDAAGALAEAHEADVIVLGGGPAGASAAIYSARKGLRVALVAERVGGQVKETVGIENLISVPHTTGATLAANLATHLADYPIEVFEHRRVEAVDLSGAVKTVRVRGGETFRAPALVLATGAGWRKLGVEGEAEYLGRGVHFCPHCDGPFYKGKRVAVVGGGNSGIEAALDLAGICTHVTVLEFADTLRADSVLVEKARERANIDIYTEVQTTAVVGNGEKVSGLRVKDRTTGEERELALDGVFVQIGLSPNTDIVADALMLNGRREIPVDSGCRTAIPGVYAAGDATDVPYKQIVVAIGEGAKAALSAFDDRMRGIIG